MHKNVLLNGIWKLLRYTSVEYLVAINKGKKMCKYINIHLQRIFLLKCIFYIGKYASENIKNKNASLCKLKVQQQATEIRLKTS